MRDITDPLPGHADDIRSLAALAAAHDHVEPLNEDALLALDHPGDERHHLVLADDGSAAAYATLDRHGHGQLVVAPGHRRHGLGRHLLTSLPADSWWSFGDLPAARALGEAAGLAPARELLILRRDLVAHPVDDPRPLADGVAIRPFVDADMDELLAVNAAAFAHHPEQGALDRDAFVARTGQDWYRAEDILLATLEDRVVGFHWTKRHGAGLGEVYVLGVHPDAEGRGLGRALLNAGLRHLASVGCAAVVLYVDGAEQRPVQLYQSASFVLHRRDVGWSRQEAGQ